MINTGITTRQLHQLLERQHLRPAGFIDLADRGVVFEATHHRAGHVADPHRLKARIAARQRNHREHLLQIGKGVQKAVARAKNNAGAQHRHVQPGAEQGRFAACLAALVFGGRIDGRAQCADVNQAPHTGGLAGANQGQRPLHMHFLKRVFRAVQDGNQVDHGVVPGHQRGQRSAVIEVDFDHIDQRQQLQVARMLAAARGHRHAA